MWQRLHPNTLLQAKGQGLPSKHPFTREGQTSKVKWVWCGSLPTFCRAGHFNIYGAECHWQVDIGTRNYRTSHSERWAIGTHTHTNGRRVRVHEKATREWSEWRKDTSRHTRYEGNFDQSNLLCLKSAVHSQISKSVLATSVSTRTRRWSHLATESHPRSSALNSFATKSKNAAADPAWDPSFRVGTRLPGREYWEQGHFQLNC